ncbi:hypothetical protein HYX17_03875 [Candidatus Woesearchaeota archaeon]|nr:hypothetical protein [Candidatus Woesearchaeota archaeon]
MDDILNVTDKSGRRIRLTKKQWRHISKEHPEIDKLDYVGETLNSPLKIKNYEYDENIKYYYKHFKERKI